jgi:hypothetical protein
MDSSKFNKISLSTKGILSQAIVRRVNAIVRRVNAIVRRVNAIVKRQDALFSAAFRGAKTIKTFKRLKTQEKGNIFWNIFCE